MIYLARATDESWLTLSRNGGIIEGHGARHIISLSCSTRRIDAHSTYVIIENLSMPLFNTKIKVMKIFMNIIRQSIRCENSDGEYGCGCQTEHSLPSVGRC